METSETPDDAEAAKALALSKLQRQRKYSQKYYQRLHPFSPIYKNDIRRTLGIMLANVLNSHDFRLFKSFLVRYCTRHCAFANIFHVPTLAQMLFPTALACPILDQQVLHCAYVFATMPDMICKMKDCRITQTKDKCSTLSITMRIIGTRVYEIGEAELFPKLQSVVLNGTSKEKENAAAPIPSLHFLDVATIRKMRVPADALLFGCETNFLVGFDEKRKMTSVEQHWCSLDLSLPNGIAAPVPPRAESAIPDIFPFSCHPPLPAELDAGELDLFDDLLDDCIW